jgi:hypothetical protein
MASARSISRLHSSGAAPERVKGSNFEHSPGAPPTFAEIAQRLLSVGAPLGRRTRARFRMERAEPESYTAGAPEIVALVQVGMPLERAADFAAIGARQQLERAVRRHLAERQQRGGAGVWAPGPPCFLA